MNPLLLIGTYLLLAAVICVIARCLWKLEKRPPRIVEKWFWKDR